MKLPSRDNRDGGGATGKLMMWNRIGRRAPPGELIKHDNNNTRESVLHCTALLYNDKHIDRGMI